MEISKLQDYIKGWFVGGFEPTAFHTEDVEVAVKTYRAGDWESKHYHKIATEITAVISGQVKMNDTTLVAGDVVKILPGEEVEFTALKDSCTVVVKVPGALNDKYLS